MSVVHTPDYDARVLSAGFLTGWEISTHGSLLRVLHIYPAGFGYSCSSLIGLKSQHRGAFSPMGLIFLTSNDLRRYTVLTPSVVLCPFLPACSS